MRTRWTRRRERWKLKSIFKTRTAGCCPECTCKPIVAPPDNRDILTVPLEAVELGADASEGSVLVVNAKNILEERKVQLGLQGSTRVEVRGGLTDGERVVVGSRNEFRSGMKVVPKEIDLAGLAKQEAQVMPKFALAYPYFIIMVLPDRRGGWRDHVVRMPVDLFPQINIPVVVVATFYSGMPPQQIEADITNHIRAILHAWQATSITSNRARLPGVSLVKIYFKPGTQRQRRVEQHRQSGDGAICGGCRRVRCRRWC